MLICSLPHLRILSPLGIPRWTPVLFLAVGPLSLTVHGHALKEGQG